MRKELLWAVAGGIFFGIIIAFGVWRVNSTFKQNGKVTKASSTPSSKNQSFKIALNSPENEDVVTESSVTVSGLTTPQSFVVFSAEDSDYIVQADQKGVFSQDVSLVPGVNQIKITAFDGKGAESATKVIVIYSSSFEKKGVSTVSTADASSEAGVRAKVEEKVADVLTRPKAYLGTVTDIADSTIQIKSATGEIKQIAVKNGDVTVIKSGKSSKEVKLTDIAIGDFIVAMGYKNGNQVLTAQRILITSEVSEPSVKAIYGAVSSTDKKSITIADNIVTPDKNTKIYSLEASKVAKMALNDIKEGDFVIYVTAGASGKSLIRSIFVLQKS